MAFQVSPGVQVQEIDLTGVIPAVSSTTGAFVGNFAWGPVGEARLVGSERDLLNLYGTPKHDASVDFLTAAYFLKYGSALYVDREVTSAAANATTEAQGTAIVVKNADDYESATFASTETVTTSVLTSSGSTTIIVSDVTALTVGDVISGDAGIPAGTTITAINSGTDTLTLSAATTADIDGTVTPVSLEVSVIKAEWIAKYPGVLGNSLRIEVCGDATSFASWTHKGLFTSAPGTSDYAAARGGSNDELHIVVIDEDGLFTGRPNDVLETFGFVSQGVDAKTNDGGSNYYKNVINNQSKYIWFGAHNADLSNAGGTVVNQTFAQLSSIVVHSLVGGADSAALGLSEIQGGYDLFEDSEVIDVSLLIMPKFEDTGATLANDLIAIAEGRKDCVAFVSPPPSATVGSTTPLTDVTTWAADVTSSSYAVIDSTALKVYDRYNDQYVWIPASSSVAGLCAATDLAADAWFSPAGFNRGQLLGVTKVAYNPKKDDRDALYQDRINPIVTFPGEGTVLYGDKTALAKPSAFDRINVRRLFIVLEKAISTAAKFQLFEFNDDVTRAQFRNAVEPFLREVKSRRGMTDFAVVCDESNNTAEVIDTNNFVADIFIKPARSINFITLSFVATRTGVEFSEVIGQ